MTGKRMLRITLFIASNRSMLPDEFDAHRLSATPDHSTVSAGPGVARERQPQFRWQYIGIVNRDLGAGGGDILHHALARRETTFEGDPCGLAQRFTRFPLLGHSHHSHCS